MLNYARFSLNAALLAGILALGVLAQTMAVQAKAVPKETPSRPQETIALVDAVLHALQNNLDITVSRQTRDIRLTDILFEQAQFDPTFNLSGRYDRRVTPLNRPILGFSTADFQTDPETFDDLRSTVGTGLTQKIITGADYELSFEVLRDKVAGETGFLFNPVYQPTFTVNISLPLLRNFGPAVNRTGIQIARNNAKVEEHVFFDQVLAVIADVEQNYWELVFAREALTVAQIALQAAEELEASNRAKARAGVMTIVDVLQAQARVANRQELVIGAEKAIGDQEDQLRRLLNPAEENLRQQPEVLPVDKPVQTLRAISLQEAIDIALQQRPEVRLAMTEIDTSKLNTKFSKNQLLPSLTLEGSGGLNGIGGTATADSIDRTVSGDFYNLGVGLVLSYPLGNRAAWSQYNKRKLEARNAQVSLQSTRQQVIISVKEAVRRVQTDFKRMETTRSARILAERQLKAEQERLNVGLSITRFVLDFQRDLAIAQRNELRAIVDYNKALSNLARQKGTTLRRYGIELQ